MSLFRFEHRTQPLADRTVFLRRMAIHAGAACGLIAGATFAGMIGYRVTEGMSWLDSYLNATMILGGMGPVGELHTKAGKIFAGAYALFAGVAFLVIVGTMMAPMAHRLLHRMHMETDD